MSCFQGNDVGVRPGVPRPGPSGHIDVPDAGDRIRAYLIPWDRTRHDRPARGGYAGTYPDWFDRTGPEPAGAAVPPAEAAGESLSRKRLGIFTQPVTIDGKPARLIAGFDEASLARGAGIRVGDAITAVNGAPASPDEAAFRRSVARSNNPIRLSVHRAGSGKAEDVSIDFVPGRELPRRDPSHPVPAPVE